MTEEINRTQRNHAGIDALVVLCRMYEWLSSAIKDNQEFPGGTGRYAEGVTAGLLMARGKTGDLMADCEMTKVPSDPLKKTELRKKLVEIRDLARELERASQ